MAKQKLTRFGRSDQRLKEMMEAEYPGGVVVDPVPITEGEEISILYHGLLAQKGADCVWLHAGYGSAEKWEEVQELPMEYTPRGWVSTFRVENGTRLNFCFRDSMNQWDNNHNFNWSFEIHKGDRDL